MMSLESNSGNDLWRQAWQAVTVTQANVIIRESELKGPSSEILHVALALNNPRQRWITSRFPPINPAFAIAEVVWILRGRNDAAFLTAWNKSLPSYSGEGPILDGAYGERLRRRFGIDQLQQAAAVLRNSPEQRQVVLQIWDPQTDLPLGDGKPQSPDVPCNIVSVLKCAEGKLEWLQVMRSNDLIRGLPYNLIQWTTIQEIIAGWIGVDVGSYVHISDSLHVYHHDLGNFSEVPGIQAYLGEDDLRLGFDESEEILKHLETTIDAMAHSDEASKIRKQAHAMRVKGYDDWLKIMAAERLRRIGAAKEAVAMAHSISNPTIRHASRSWIERNRSAG